MAGNRAGGGDVRPRRDAACTRRCPRPGPGSSVTVADAPTSRMRPATSRYHRRPGAPRAAADAAARFDAGAARARIGAAGGAERPLRCVRSPSTRSDTPPRRSRTSALAVGSIEPRADDARRLAGPLAAAAGGRARRQLRQRPRGDPLAGRSRGAGDRGRPPPGRPRLPLAPRPSRALARSRQDEEAYVGYLADLAERHFRRAGRGAVRRTTRRSRSSARNADAPRRLRLPGSGWDVLEPLQRKRHQYEVAEAAGIGVPLHVRSSTARHEAARRRRASCAIPRSSSRAIRSRSSAASAGP